MSKMSQIGIFRERLFAHVNRAINSPHANVMTNEPMGEGVPTCIALPLWRGGGGEGDFYELLMSH